MAAGAETGLRRELGLRDVALLAIACMTASRWIPAAAHAGPGSVTLWVLGAAFFVVPLAIVIGALAVKNPGAGGFYLWTRQDFGPWHGFLCFWVYWVGMAFWFPTASMFYMRMGLYALGPAFAGRDQKPGNEGRRRVAAAQHSDLHPRRPHMTVLSPAPVLAPAQVTRHSIRSEAAGFFLDRRGTLMRA